MNEDVKQARPSTKELVAASIELLAGQLAAGHTEGLKTYLAAMGRFHSYSLANILEIARQRPAATRVAGFQTWKAMGRSVNKGEKGIRILAPVRRAERRQEAGKDEAREQSIVVSKTPMLAGFRTVYVFDESQTSGQHLPELSSRASGNVGVMLFRLQAFVEGKGISIVYTDTIAPALGVSYGGRIAILPGQTDAETFATLVHETAHEMLHKKEARAKGNATVRELEAEAVAFAVSVAVGLDMGNSSVDYIGLYKGDSALLVESLARIQTTAAEVLDGILAADETTKETRECLLQRAA